MVETGPERDSQLCKNAVPSEGLSNVSQGSAKAPGQQSAGEVIMTGSERVAGTRGAKLEPQGAVEGEEEL